MIALAFLKALWGKVAFKFALGVTLALVCYFTGKAYVDYRVDRARNEILNAPAIVTRDTVQVHDTLTVHKITKIQGEVVKETVNVSAFTREQLQRMVQPFGITQPITVTDDSKKVGVSFDLAFLAHPIDHSVTNFTMSNIVSTYPKETVKETHYVQEPYRQNLLDLFVAVDIGGAFNRKGTAGMARTGIDLNIGAVTLSGAIGAASERSKMFGLWTAGIKVSTK